MSDRARKAQQAWAQSPPLQRSAAMTAAAAALDARAAELVELGVAEVGKPVTEMSGEVQRGVGILRYYAQQVLAPEGETYPAADARGLLLARRRPHGVAGLITPWNFPVAIPLWKLAPAIAYGNAVLLKPSPDATATAARLQEILASSLPPDLVTLVLGGATAGRAVVEHSDAVSFTGSVTTGQAITAQAAALGKPVQAEMGGQNPSIVLEDADPAVAANAIAAAAMGYAGQKCTATSRVIVVGPAGELAAALVEAIRGLVVGDPAEPTTALGPVITERAREAVRGAVVAATDAGARILTGGRPLDCEGWYFEPTLLDRVAPTARVAQEEVFGPLAVLLPAANDAEALALANGVRYGLAGAVFTTDLERALRFTSAMEVGLARVNGPTTGVDYYLPFGGTKASSVGPREQGTAARDFYTWTQTVALGVQP